MSKLYNREQAALALGLTPKAVRWLEAKLSDEDRQRYIRRNGKLGGDGAWGTTTEGIEALRLAQRVVTKWESGDRDKVIAEFRRSGSVSEAAKVGGTYYNKAYYWLAGAGLIVKTPRKPNAYNGIRRLPIDILKETFSVSGSVSGAAEAAGMTKHQAMHALVKSGVYKPKHRSETTLYALRMMGEGYPNATIANICGLTQGYLRNLRKEFRAQAA